MSLSAQELVTQIHAAPMRMVLAASGGGTGTIAALLQVPGSSRTILEAIVPYCEGSMVAFLGGRPDQFCSERTARAMAMAAFRRARGYEPDSGRSVAGVACTSALLTDRPKSGPHRTHVALQTASQTAFWSLQLTKGARSRAEEEALVDCLLLNAVADACQLPGRLDVTLLAGETIVADRVNAPQAWQDLLLGKVESVCQGAPPDRINGPRAIFPGEFNPMHIGHQRMAELAQQRLGVPVEFEIATTNVEKPPLDYWEIGRRLTQFTPDQTVWLTRATRFVDKSRLFAGATFVVGIDTLRRLAAPRYYGDDPAACRAAIEAIASRRCRFLVFGRNLGTGFVGLGDLELPVERFVARYSRDNDVVASH